MRRRANALGVPLPDWCPHLEAGSARGLRERAGRTRRRSSSALEQAQHEASPVTLEKLRWLLTRSVAAFGERRLDELQPYEIAAWRMTIRPGYRFEATQALRQVLQPAVVWGLLDVNPAKLGVENPQRRPTEKRPFERLVEANERLEARVAELERRLSRSSRNSSLPPSQDPPSAPPRPRGKGSGRKRGGQHGHEGRYRRLLPPERVDEFVEHWPERCGSCAHEFAESGSRRCGRACLGVRWRSCRRSRSG